MAGGFETGNAPSGTGVVQQPQLQQAAVPTVSFETGRHYKVHSSYVWLGPLLALLLFIVIGGLNSIQLWVELAIEFSRSGIAPNALMITLLVIGGIVVLYGLLVGLYALAYKNMSYVFDEREFSFYSGIITKRRVHVPYARIQSVNHKASIFQRFAGVCSVTIDSAGGSSNKAVRVPYLQLGVAERLRVDLFVRKAAVAAGIESQLVYAPELDTATEAGAQREEALAQAQRAAAPTAPWQMTGAASGMPGASGTLGASSAQGGVAQSANVPSNALDDIAAGLGEWRGAWGGSVAGLEPVSFETGLSNSELGFTSFSHSTPLALAISLGLTALVTVGAISTADDPFANWVAMASVPIVVASFVVSFLLGVLGIAVSYGNFKARRRGSRIEVERGLLQRSFSGIDVERVQSIEIRQSFIRRLMGYCEVSLGRINTQNGETSNQNSNLDARGLVVHPFMRLDQADAFIDQLVPELVDRPRVVDLHPVSRVALRREIMRRCVWFNWAFWTAIAALIVWLVLSNWIDTSLVDAASQRMAAAHFQLNIGLAVVVAICVASTALGALGAVFWARGSGYAWNRRYVALRNDGLWTSYIAIPRNKIQSGNTRTNPFQRRLDLATIVATTAAGTRSTSSRLLDIDQADAEAYLEWLKPRV